MFHGQVFGDVMLYVSLQKELIDKDIERWRIRRYDEIPYSKDRDKMIKEIDKKCDVEKQKRYAKEMSYLNLSHKG